MTAGRPLEGKTALVTGGGGAIGSACARLLAEDGAAVMLMGRREAQLEKARRAIRNDLPDAEIRIFAGDACQADVVEAAIESAHRIRDRLDILVSTVGGGEFKPVLLQDTAGMTDAYTLNVVSAFLLVKHGVPRMEPEGAIVCISSLAAAGPIALMSAYCMAKAALEMFVQIAADEISGAGIRINAVRPGLTRTEASAGLFADPAMIERLVAGTPLARPGEPEDIARVARFLAGPESGWVTGQSFASDGGQGLRKDPAQLFVLDSVLGKDFMDEVRAGKPPRP